MRFEAGRYEPGLDGAAIAADLLVAHRLAPSAAALDALGALPGA